MNSQKNKPPMIDNKLFKFYSQYKMCKIEKSSSLNESEKAAMISILKSFQFVDGNLIRSIINEAFEHSSSPDGFCFPLDKKVDTAAHDVPNSSSSSINKNKTQSMATMIDLTLDDDSDSFSSPKHTCSTPTHKVSSSSEDSEDASDYESNESHSDCGSYFNRKRKFDTLEKHKGKERADEIDLQGVLSKDSSRRLGNILRQAEQSKSMLQERMRTVNASFDLQIPFPNDTSSYGNTEMFRINREFSRKSRLNQCQEHLAAYKIGKLAERDKKIFSDDIVYRNTKRYYQGLIKKLKFYSRSEQQDFVYFPTYCRRVVRMVENIGLYAIFIPEILPPYRIKLTSTEEFEKIENHLAQRCFCFKNIAHFDQNGILKMEDRKGNHTKDIDQGSSSISQLLS